MNIFSKELLYNKKKSLYEAYYIYNGTMTSLGQITDLSKTSAARQNGNYSRGYVFDGDFYYDNTLIYTGSITSLCAPTSGYGYFVDNGDLYQINSGKASKISSGGWKEVFYSDSNCLILKTDGLYFASNTSTRATTITSWDKVTGCPANDNNRGRFGYGISEGKLYYIYALAYGSYSVEQQGNDTTWTDIAGQYLASSSYCGYGINNGKLYMLGTSITQVGNSTGWTKLTGVTNTNQINYSLGINNGKLYIIQNTTLTQVGTSTNWLNCSGVPFINQYVDRRALAYDNSALYNISGNGNATKLMNGEWVYCGGTYQLGGSVNKYYAIAIRKVV